MCLWQARMSWNKRVWYRQRQRRSKRQRWEQRCLYNFHFSFASLISISLRSVIYNVFVLFSFLIFFVFLGVLIQRDILFRFLCLCEFDLCASFHVGLSVYGVCVCVYVLLSHYFAGLISVICTIPYNISNTLQIIGLMFFFLVSSSRRRWYISDTILFTLLFLFESIIISVCGFV